MSAGFDKSAINAGLLLDLTLSEATGTVVLDRAKPRHPIVMINSPTWSKLSSGLGVNTLNGTNQWLECAAVSCADLNFTSGDFSAAIWVTITTPLSAMKVGPTAAWTGTATDYRTYTVVDKATPASANGTMFKFLSAWAQANCPAGAKIALFSASGNNLTAHAVYTLPEIPAGSVQTVVLSPGVTVNAGEYLGLWYPDPGGSSPMIEVQASGGSGYWYHTGDQTGCNGLGFSSVPGQDLMFGGLALNTDDSSQRAGFFVRGVDGTDGWSFTIDQSSGRLTTSQAGASQKTTSSDLAYSASGWTLYGFSRAGSSVRLFCNGRVCANLATGVHVNPATASRKLHVGTSDAESSFLWAGSLGLPRIWGRALSPAEHMEIFNRERALFGV